MQKYITTLLLGLLVPLALTSVSYSQTYDLVILNGRVMDPETYHDSIANVGIVNGRIAVITNDPIDGTDVIDATGLVVAPGFIDTHVHGVDPFTSKMRLRDGVTTAMDLEAGATRVGEWYEQKAAEGWQLNYGTTTSHPMNRMLVHDPEVIVDQPMDMISAPKYIDGDGPGCDSTSWSLARDTIETMNAVSGLLDEDLRQGALGVAAMPAYMSRGLTTYALFDPQRVAARYGRLTAEHTRFHLSSETPAEMPLGFDEVCYQCHTS